jgi:hypothetical protein
LVTLFSGHGKRRHLDSASPKRDAGYKTEFALYGRYRLGQGKGFPAIATLSALRFLTSMTWLGLKGNSVPRQKLSFRLMELGSLSNIPT